MITDPRRPLFVATILVGSFLLFLVQPMVARMALPQLGGAPNVWNSAMLVYQALLLAGYGYAHYLSHMPVRRQATIHLALLAVAALTLPVGLVHLAQPDPGQEVWWVPLLLGLSIGPVFFLVSAQAPLMQRWYSADPHAGEPWALYAASNIGSFTGLIAYPLLAEPMLRLHQQSWGWALGYALLFALVALAARTRWTTPVVAVDDVKAGNARVGAGAEPLPLRTILLWLGLSAVPSGLMLSTTTHLTTDLFAMPLLWVIPLGLYLLSFVFAFSDNRGFARVIAGATPSIMLLGGGLAMTSRHAASLSLVMVSVGLLFAISVTLHARLYALRPDPSRLTLFYFVMSAGGALGGLFTALIAPVVFDWVWEHPLLVFAGAALLPRLPDFDWRGIRGLTPDMARLAAAVLFLCSGVLCWQLYGITGQAEPGPMRLWLTMGIALMGFLLYPWRGPFLAVLAMLMLAQGGMETFDTTREGLRTRSYFGIYTVRDYPTTKLRTLAHGTTLHGQQSLDPLLRNMPLTYYGPGSGVGITMAHAEALFGGNARIGVVGLGTGSLACYHHKGQDLRYFEIDPAVAQLSRDGKFTFIKDCAPETKLIIGDARLELAKAQQQSFDLLAIDAFSSDAIPLHLLTDEAFGIYLDALSPKGVLLVHISNRYIELEPVLAAEAAKRGLTVALRDDVPGGDPASALYTPSSWVLMTRDPAQLVKLRVAEPELPWKTLMPAASRAWTDDHASILPYVRWDNILGKP